jgi:hypothetical protein
MIAGNAPFHTFFYLYRAIVGKCGDEIDSRGQSSPRWRSTGTSVFSARLASDDVDIVYRCITDREKTLFPTNQSSFDQWTEEDSTHNNIGTKERRFSHPMSVSCSHSFISDLLLRQQRTTPFWTQDSLLIRLATCGNISMWTTVTNTTRDPSISSLKKWLFIIIECLDRGATDLSNIDQRTSVLLPIVVLSWLLFHYLNNDTCSCISLDNNDLISIR